MDEVDLNADPSVEAEPLPEEPVEEEPEFDIGALVNQHFGPLLGG